MNQRPRHKEAPAADGEARGYDLWPTASEGLPAHLSEPSCSGLLISGGDPEKQVPGQFS